ncbi:response regulator [candidate division KSB1 bacterium]
MSIITIFSGTFCNADDIAKKAAYQLGYDFITEKTLIGNAAKVFSTSKEKLSRVLYGTPSFLNNITHEKERNIAYLQNMIGELIKKDNVIFNGFAGLLLPKEILHVLKVYIIANQHYRIDHATKTENVSNKEANKLIRKNDNDRVRWTLFLFEKTSWDKSLYDIIIPMHSTTFDEAVSLIVENVKKKALKTTIESQNAIDDFILASRIKIELLKKGHAVDVTSKDNNVTVFIKKYVIRFENYKKELEDIVKNIPGIKSYKAKYNSNVNLPSIVRKIDLDIPSKVLLVDDEIEYVHTLSERLRTRSLESLVAYDGEEALNVIEEEEPEVMILDLKMPGIDGIEVLRNVKKTNPNVEVIIVTGHGSAKEKRITEELGAFAYLEKPVEIETLAKIMKEAYKKSKK